MSKLSLQVEERRGLRNELWAPRRNSLSERTVRGSGFLEAKGNVLQGERRRQLHQTQLRGHLSEGFEMKATGLGDVGGGWEKTDAVSEGEKLFGEAL